MVNKIISKTGLITMNTPHQLRIPRLNLQSLFIWMHQQHYLGTQSSDSCPAGTVWLCIFWWPASCGASFTWTTQQGTAKWTLKAIGGWPFGHDVHNFTLLSNLTANDNLDQIRKEHNKPQENITTYTWSSSIKVTAVQLELFDFAYSDGQQVVVHHSLEQEGSTAEIGHYPTSFPLSSFHSLFPPSPITLSAS